MRRSRQSNDPNSMENRGCVSSEVDDSEVPTRRIAFSPLGSAKARAEGSPKKISISLVAMSATTFSTTVPSNCRKANFGGANLRGARLEGAQLEGAHIEDAQGHEER